MKCISFIALVLIFSENITSIVAFTRIVGGYPAHIESFPYVVSVQVLGRHICGGAIISRSFILTAAHCVEKRIPCSIVAGTDNLLQRGVAIRVRSIIIHPEYDAKIANYDIALLRLIEPLVFVEHTIMNVILPKASETIPLDIGTVMGWGMTNNRQEKMSQLRAVDLEVYTEEICRQSFNITKAMFCAGHISGRKDSCNGDSGGPFVIDDVLYGLVSYGTPECAVGAPGVYAKIPLVVDWIKKRAKISDTN